METKRVERRTVLKAGAAAVGMLGSGASASMVAGVQQASADTPPSSVPDQILAAFQRFRETIQQTLIMSTSRRPSDRFS